MSVLKSVDERERLRRWNNPTALEDFSVTARGATKQDEDEEKQLIDVDRHALKELTFQMSAEGKQLVVQLDSLHETVSKETLECEHRESLSEDLRKRTCGIGKEVKALGILVEELQQLLRKAKDNSNVSQEHGRELKDVDLAKPTDQLSREELKARLEILETEKREMIEEKKDWKREVEFLKFQLQYRGEMKALQESSDSSKLEEENALLRKENYDMRQKLDSFINVTREHGLITDLEELSVMFNCSPSHDARESRKSDLHSELEILRKERKILLATVLKQQAAEKASFKSNETVNVDVTQTDVLVSSECGDELRKKLEGLHAEMEALEQENKTLDDENSKLIEEKRELEYQVNKLKSQIADALESNFDEIEHLNQSQDDLRERFDLIQRANKGLLQASSEFKEKCASHFEAALAKIEEKQSYEVVIVYMTDAIDQLLEFDDEASALTASELDAPRTSTERTRSSNLLAEIKVCKDEIENLRQQIRQTQFDKRDLEELLTKMKRELMILKSKKRQGKREEFQVVNVNQSESNAEEGNEAIQQEIGFLKSRQSELEKLARTLKEDNYKLDNEKFCLLGSFYHLLERNEALEEQVVKMKEHDVIYMDKTKERLSEEKEKPFDEGDLTRPTQPRIQPHDSEYLMEEEGTKDAFTDDLTCEIQRIADKLRDVQEFLLDTEGEKKNLKDELGESKKNEHEFRTAVMQLNLELTVLKGRVGKVQELNDTLHDCLREVHDEKRELIDSLDESNEDKVVLERSLETTEDQLNNLQRDRDALQNALDKTDNASQEHLVMRETLSKLCTVLANDEISSGQPTNDEQPAENETELDIEGLCKRSSLVVDKVFEETERLRTEWKRYKLDSEQLKSRVDALSIEKLALQKYVRELDDKKRQMKIFITRLTAEKETLADDIDEIKQQKLNLADALENVYHSKEEVQSKLDEAMLKVRQVTDESKTLRESLCRVVKERDVVNVTLLAEKQQLHQLRESEQKWRELAMGSHTEADQVIEVDKAIKEEMVNGRFKVEESQAIIQLRAERDELLNRVDSILTAKKTSNMDEHDETTENDQEEIQLHREQINDSIQDCEERERADATSIKAEHLMPLQKDAEFAVKDDVSIRANASTVDNEKWREDKETLEELLKQSAEENQQLRDWLDAVFVEKGRLEQELDNTTEENKDLVRDLQRSSEDKVKLKLLLQRISVEKESQLDRQLDESSDEQHKQNLEQVDGSSKQHELEELHDSVKESRDSLEQTVKELTEKRATMETDMERALEDIRYLTNQIGIIRREKEEYVASFEKASVSNRILETKYKQLMEEDQYLKNLNKESVQQADVLRLKNAELSESNKRLTDDLKNSRKTLEKTLQNAQELRKEIKSLSADNQSLKRDTERAKEEESELKEKLTVTQQANDGMTFSLSVLNAANEASDAKCLQLADDLEDARATAKAKIKIEEQCKSVLMTKQEKLLLVEEELKNLFYECGEESSVAEEGESQPEEEELFQDPLDQLKTVRQTLQRRAEESKEVKNSLNCLQKKVNELRKFIKTLELEICGNSGFTDEVPMHDDKNKTGYKIIGETIVHTLENVQKGFEEILIQKTLVVTKLEGEIVTSEEKVVKLVGDLEKVREHLSIARKSNEDAKSAFEELKKEQEGLKCQVGESKHVEETNHKLKQKLRVVENVITELQTEKAALLIEKDKHMAFVTSEKAQMLEQMNNEVRILAATKDDLSKTLKAAQESVCDSKRQLEQSNILVRSLQKEVENTSKQLRKSKNENEHLNLRMSELDKEKNKRHKVLKDLENKNVALEKQAKETKKKGVKIQALCKEVIEAKKQIVQECLHDYQEQKDNVESMPQGYGSELEVVAFTVKRLENIISKLTEENRELVAQKREQETSLKEVSEGKNDVERKLKEQTECSKSTVSKFEETRKALNKSQEERKDLKGCVASLDKDKRTLQKQLKDIKVKLEKKQKEQDSLMERLNNEQLRIKNLEELLKNAATEEEGSRSSIQEREEETRRLDKRNREVESRIKEMDAEIRTATDKKKRLEKQLTSEKCISADLRLRVDEANEDKDELEEILEQRRNNYKKLNDELEESASQKEVVEGKLDSALAKLEKVEEELRGKVSYSEERDAKLKQSEDERKALRRKLDESTKKVFAVRMRLKERTSDDGKGKVRKADNIGTDIKGNEEQEISQLEKEVFTVAQKNEDLSERLNEADMKISVLEKKVQQLKEEKERLERSQQAGKRLGVALECAKEDENRLRRQLEESKHREGDLETRLQGMIEQMEHISPHFPSAVKQECAALERVLVSCAEVPEPSQAANVNSTCTNDKNNATLLEAQVCELRTELRKVKHQMFDLQQDLSDGKRALRQKERLHQQERARFQQEIEEIEGECDKLRRELSSLGEVEVRRSSFSTVMDLKGTLRKAESDMWDVISKTSRLLERAKDDMKEVTGREGDKSPTTRTDLHRSDKIDREKEDLRKKVEDLAKQKDHLEKRLRRAEGMNEMLKQSLGDTIADVHRFRCLINPRGESSDNAKEPTTLKKMSGKQEIEIESEKRASNLIEVEELRTQLEELRKIIKDIEKSLLDEKSIGEGSILDNLRGKHKLEVVNENLRQRLGQSVQDREESLKREKRLEELLLRSQCENTAKVNAKHEVQKLGGNNELRDRLRQSEAHVQDLTNEIHQIRRENGELRFECTQLRKEVLEVSSVLENKSQLEQDRAQSRHENPKTNTVLEVTLHKTQEAMQMLQKEKETLEAQCNLLQGQVREIAQGNNQLLEDALSFKVKYLKKNQELASVLETKEHDINSLQMKNEGLASLIQEMEDDMEALRLQSHAVKLEKERIYQEHQLELENLRKIRGRHDELNVTLKHMSSEINELEDRNRALLEENAQMAQEYEAEKAELLLERNAIVSRLRDIEEENKLESSLKEVREDKLREKEEKLEKDCASIKKEKENLGNVTTKIQQMRGEYRQLESEYNVLMESINETSNENTTLKKENSLIRRACVQLRRRKSLAEEKILEDVNELEVESVPPREHKPERAIIRENVIPIHRATQASANKDDFPFISDDKAFKRHSIAHSTRDQGKRRASEGLLIPISLSVQRKSNQPSTFVDRQRASSLPMEQGLKTRQGRTGVKISPHNAPLLVSSPVFSSDSSSRGSEVDSSVCSRRHYCSPILSVVDLCPLHHGFPLERRPSPCPVCRKTRERTNSKEFVSSEKYV